MKRIISLSLSFILALNICFAVSGGTITSLAATSYEAQLKSKGFPESYIDDLVALHNKYPNWIFKPLKTGLNWSTAVSGERSKHSKQLIEKNSSTNTNMYCKCASCYKNSAYTIQEASNWVSASQEAVEYYMDPRNWLNEKGIFQFESTAYDGTQTKSGVESILKGTWMADSLITYISTAGNKKNYDSSTKYSDAIMKAASDSGMSAYYLASKIKQENGGTTASATAVNGTTSPFQGIFNYYNIGANTGAKEGLAWAAGYLKLNEKTTLHSDYNSSTKKVSGTKTSLSSGQYMTFIGSYGDYYQVRLYTENSANSFTEGKIGYVLKSACRTTYFNNGRPWTNPYKSIYYGAQYIADNFSTQTSGYLQKFNVNPKSSELYGHEYMANVAAAAAESSTTYNAYKAANILSITKTFEIPVFDNMPNDTTVSTTASSSTALSKVTLPTTVMVNATQIRVYWNKVSNATGYQIYWAKDSGFKNIIAKTNISSGSTTSYTGSNFTAGTTYYIKVRALKKSGSTTTYGSWSDVRTAKYSSVTTPSSVSTSAKNTTSVTLKWTKVSAATGYQLMLYKNGVWEEAAWISSNTNSYKVTGLSAGKSYSFKVRAYITKNNVRNYSGWKEYKVSTNSSATPAKVTVNTTVIPSTTQIKISWNKVSGATGYQIYWAKDSGFKNVIAKTSISSGSTTSYTGKGFTKGNTYYIKIRALKKSGSKTTYGSWSNTITAKYTSVKTPSSISSSAKSTTSATLKWSKVSNATGYQLMIYKNKAWVQAAWISSNKTSYKVTGLTAGTQYSFKVRAYVTKNNVRNYSTWKSCSVITSVATPTLSSLSSPKSTQIKASWKKASGSVTGYQLYWASDKKFSNVVAKTNISSSKTTSYTGKNFTKGKTYYVKVRAYKTINKKTYYSSWSAIKSIKCK
ncbi:MAG: fibronectin type III domain-containing protein [Clostridium sp.]|nr:fibronectin type III domain-containing protein [Clostridium sp.]